MKTMRMAIWTMAVMKTMRMAIWMVTVMETMSMAIRPMAVMVILMLTLLFQGSQDKSSEGCSVIAVSYTHLTLPTKVNV